MVSPGKYLAGGLQSGCTANLTGTQYKIMKESRENDMEKQDNTILYGVPKVAYGQDGCTPFPMCVHSCGKYLGIPLDYTRAMAESGAAFRLAWNTA